MRHADAEDRDDRKHLIEQRLWFERGQGPHIVPSEKPSSAAGIARTNVLPRARTKLSA